MSIPSFEDFISEQLWSKGIERSKSSIKRIEDENPFDKLCKFSGEIIAKKLKIDYSPDLCTYSALSEEPNDSTMYEVVMNFGDLGEEYSNIQFEFDIYDDDFDNFDKVCHHFFYALDTFQDEMDYEDYRDPYMSSKKEFNKIKRILANLVDEIRKKF